MRRFLLEGLRPFAADAVEPTESIQITRAGKGVKRSNLRTEKVPESPRFLKGREKRNTLKGSNR